MPDSTSKPITVSPTAPEGDENFNRVSTPKTLMTNRRSCCTNLVIGIVLMVIGIILLVVGIVFGTVIPNSLDSRITSASQVCNADDLPDNFNEPYGNCETCAPYYYAYRPFSVENALEVLADTTQSVKVQVKEQGPYTYRKNTFRVGVKIANNKITYRSYNKWTFVPSLSCKGCNDRKDSFVKMDLSYVAVMTRAGGERAFATRLGETLLAQIPQPQRDAILGIDGVLNNLVKVVNGLNSLNPAAMGLALNTFQLFQKGNFTDFADVQLEGLPFSGVFTKRPVYNFAIGTPSFTAGIAAGGQLSNCNANAKFCFDCDFDNPSPICRQNWAACKGCQTARNVVRVSEAVLCPQLNASLTAQVGASLANQIIGETCGSRCVTDGICLAPLPGAVEGSGFDYNVVPVVESTLPVTVQDSGCKNVNLASEYEVYENTMAYPVWNQQADNSANPTAQELQIASTFNYCDAAKKDSITCSEVRGGDGAIFPPAGANVKGLKDDPAFDMRDLFVSQARGNVTLFDTEEDVVVEGVTLRRYRPEENILDALPWNKNKGIAVPVNGVRNIAYSTGFLFYVSFPFFMHGDDSLLTDIDLRFADGTQVTKDALYDSNGRVKSSIKTTYGTYLDVEPATGRAFNARKRLMASYGLARVDATNEPISNLNFPALKPEVAIPVYYGEERATLTPTLASKFNKANRLGNSCLPVLIVGVVVGSLTMLLGAFYILRHKRQRALSY